MGKKIYAGMQKTSMKDYFLQFSSVGLVVFLLVTFFPTRDYLAERIFAIYSLDINPSIVIKVGEEDNVLQIEGLNEEARDLLGNFNYFERNIEEVVSEIVEKSIEAGYVHNQRTNYFLLSKLTMEGEVATGGEELVDLIYFKVKDLIDGEAEVHILHGQREAFVEGMRRDMSPGMVLLLRDFEERNIQLVQEDGVRIDTTNRDVELLVQNDDERPNYYPERVNKVGQIKAFRATDQEKNYAISYFLMVNEKYYEIDFGNVSKQVIERAQSSAKVQLTGRYNSNQNVIEVEEVEVVPTIEVAATSPTSPTSKNRRVAIVLVNYRNQKLARINTTNARNAFFSTGHSVRTVVNQSSYGQINLSGNVYTVNLSNIRTHQNSRSFRHTLFQNVRSRIDASNYHHIVMMHPNTTSSGAWAQVGCSTPPCAMWMPERWGVTNMRFFPDIYNEWIRVMSHEIGHNFGLFHASIPGQNEGDWSCLMGGGATMYHAPHMNYMGLFDRYSGAVRTVNSNGTYTLSALSTNPNSTSNPQLLQIPIPNKPGQFYSVSYRQHSGQDAQVNCSVPYVNRCMPSRFVQGASIHETRTPRGFLQGAFDTYLQTTLSSSNPNWSKDGITVRQTGRTAGTVTLNISGVASAVTRSLTVRSSGVNGVSITATPATYSDNANYTKTGIEDGKEITLRAPLTSGGATFTGWSGTGCSTSNRDVKVTMSANRTCTANYKASASNTYNLNVRSSGASNVNITGNPAIYGKRTNYTVSDINEGTTLTLRAPLTSGGRSFTGWTGTGCTTSNRDVKVAMSANRTCTANYESTTTWWLSVNSTTSVNISASPATYGGNTNYQRTRISHGTKITLTAPQRVGNQTFSRWAGTGCISNNSSVTVSMTTNRACTAIYETSATQKRTLTVRSSGVSIVSINANPTNYSGSTTYSRSVPSGTTVRLTAPSTSGGRSFAGWSGTGCSSSSPSVNVTMSANRTCTANYQTPSGNNHNLRVRSSGISLVNISSQPSGYGGHTEYNRSVPAGTTVRLTAPSTVGNWQFDRWSGTGCSSSSQSVNVTMSTSRTCTANYKLGQLYNLRVASSGANNVHITGNPGRFEGITNYVVPTTAGSTARLTAPTTSGGASFMGWSGAGCTTNSRTVNVSMTTNRNCTANYGQVSDRNHTLTVNSSGISMVNVTASPSTYGGRTNYIKSVSDGTRISLTAPATVGNWEFKNWSGNNCSGTSRTISGVMNVNRTCVANYKMASLSLLRVNSSGASNVHIVGEPGQATGFTNYSTYLITGTTVRLTAPSTVGNRQFDRWTGTGCSTTNRSVNVSMTTARTCTARYLAPTTTAYDLTVRSSGGVTGVTINANPSQFGGVTFYQTSVVAGTTVRLTAPQKINSFQFQRWTGTGCSTTANTVNVSMTTARDCTAVYAVETVNTNNLYVRSDGVSNVNINANPSQYSGRTDYNYAIPVGQQVRLTAPATVGSYQFTGWSGTGCTGTSQTVIVTMSSNRFCRAHYHKDDSYQLTVRSGNVSNVNINANPSSFSGRTTYSKLASSGTNVRLEAPSRVGEWHFHQWRGIGCTSNSRTTNVSMTTTRTCIAEYRKESTPVPSDHRLTVIASGKANVSITSSPSGYGGTPRYTRDVPDGQTITLTAPQSGSNNYTFRGWTGTGGCEGTSNSITLTVRQNTSCTANYRTGSAPSSISLVTFINNKTYTSNSTINVPWGSNVHVSWQSDLDIPTSCQARGMLTENGAIVISRVDNVRNNGYIEITCSNNRGTISRRFDFRVN